MPSSVRPTRRTLLATTLTLAVLATGACGGGSKKPTAPTPTPLSAVQAGQELARRLTEGDLGDFPIKSGDPAADLQAVAQGMGGLRPNIEAKDTIRNGAGATVNLGYTWPLSYPWTYTAKATLVNEDRTWKLVWKPEAIHPSLSSETRLERTMGEGSRAAILGANNAVINGAAPAQMVGIDKAQVQGSDAEASARALAALVLIDPDKYAARVAAAPEKARVDAIAVQRNSLPTDALTGIRGAVQRDMTLPVGRDPGFARSLVGTVTTAGADDAAQSNGRLAEGDVIGRTGLQERFDSQLRGGGASKVFLAPRAAAPGVTKPSKDNTIADFQARSGSTLATTIDANVQTYLEDAIRDANVRVAAAAVRVSDGAILGAGESRAGGGRPESTTGEFRPGLAAGAVTGLALLRSGAKPDDKVTCDKTATVDGATIERPKGSSAEGSMTLAQAIARGCAPAVAAQANRVQPDTLAGAAAALGLTGTPDVGFAAKNGALADVAAEGARAQALAGTDQLGVSALGLATMGASVAAGRPVMPWVTESLRPAPGGQLSPEEANALQSIMKSGAGSTSLSVNGALEGSPAGADVLVAYTKDVAFAVVVTDPDRAKVKTETVVRQMQAGLARTGPAKKSSSSDDD